MQHISRREFLQVATAAMGSSGLGLMMQNGLSQSTVPGQGSGLEILSPQNRVPLSFIIDDSTCLVNMGHFCTPQFAEAHPERDVYKKDWKAWPREIPDAFVREFGEWCAEHGVKGKYSIVPNPACVGWLDRELPGWSRRELLASLKLVRELMLPNWDIHPEMITHTRVIDLKTGRPMQQISLATMENSYPRQKKSVDELAAYLAYALRILKNCELPCEGITTPGGFGNLVKPELSLAVQQAVRDVFAVEIPHYFKYVNTGNESTQPKLEHLSGRDTDDVRVTVNIPAGTGDWFGGWQGDLDPNGRRYSNADASSGRMVDLIQRGEPALMLCHWPGMYSNGTKVGFEQFKNVVRALDQRFRDHTIWMKLSEIARYWAAKHLTQATRHGKTITLQAAFAAPNFTMRISGVEQATPRVTVNTLPLKEFGRSNRPIRKAPLNETRSSHKKPLAAAQVLTQKMQRRELQSGTWVREEQGIIVCFDLPKGQSVLTC